MSVVANPIYKRQNPPSKLQIQLHLPRKPRVTSSPKTFPAAVFLTQPQTFPFAGSVCTLQNFPAAFCLWSMFAKLVCSSGTSLSPIIIGFYYLWCKLVCCFSCVFDASPVRRDGSLGCNRFPSPPPRTSRGRMQTPSAAVSRWGSRKRGGAEKSSKSDLPSRGNTMTRSSSRGASPAFSVGKSSRSGSDDVKSAADYHLPLTVIQAVPSFGDFPFTVDEIANLPMSQVWFASPW